MSESMKGCFPCFWKTEKKYLVQESLGMTGYDVLYIEVPEKDRHVFENIRPAVRELTLSEYMALYSYVIETPLPQPLYDCEHECFYFLNGDRFVILQGWVPKKRAPWMRPSLVSIPKDRISFIGKFREAKGFRLEKRYEVKEYECTDGQNIPAPNKMEDGLLKKLRQQNRPRSPAFTKLFP